jgi:precorrin-2 dehydrogenase/sirohydrochlorin ferrochelatase
MLPIVLDCADWPVLLAGQGAAAVRRLATLNDAGCRRVVVYGPENDHALRDAAGDRFRPGLPGEDAIAGHRLLLLAGLSAHDNAALAALARRHRVLLHVQDELPLCDFHMPATVRRGALLLTASTGGASPALAARLRAWLEVRFGPEWGEHLERAARLRADLKAAGRSAELGPAVNALADREAWFDEPARR